MDNKTTDSKVVVTNFIWNLMERWGAQGVTFIVSIILARLLEPSVYGIVALATVFTAILGVFIDSGLGSALVQKKDADDKDFSTVFFFNITMCSVLYIIVFFLAPLIASFYKMPELTPVVRVSSLTLIISGFKNILISVIQRNLKYKKFFFATLGGTIGAAVLGITMAFLGFGVWALIAQNLFNAFVDTIILWITVGWRPKKYFSFARLKALLPFGVRMLGTTLIGTLYLKLRDLIIGKKYSAADLAYYTKGSGWPNLLFVNIGGAVDSVMFPVISRAQDDLLLVRTIMSRTIRINTYVVFPLLVGLALCAEPAVSIILTSKWLPIVQYMRIFCFVSACDAVHNTQINMIRSIGKSKLYLRIDIIKKVIGFLILLIAMTISVKAIAYSLLLTKIIELSINIVIVKKLLSYPIIEQVKDVSMNVLLCVLMAIPLVLISFFSMPDFVKILVEILVGVSVYLIASKVLKVESYQTVKGVLKKIIKRKK